MLLVVLITRCGMGRKSVFSFGAMRAAGAILALVIHRQVSDIHPMLSEKF